MSDCVACLCYGCVHAEDIGLMYNLCSMHALDRVHFCILLTKRRKRGKFGGIRMVWCLRPGIQKYHLDSWGRVVHWCDQLTNGLPHVHDRRSSIIPLVLTAWGGRSWAWQRVERPPLVLIAWCGRTLSWVWWGRSRVLPLS